MTSPTPDDAVREALAPCPFCQDEMIWESDEESGWSHPNRRQEPLSTCWLADAWITPGTGEGSAEEWNRRAALPSLSAPKGWKLVPVEATREMWAAMGDALVGYRQRHHDTVAEAIWSGVLAAAPPPPTEQKEER